jgi:putative component of membrane protein insertase Oxa1/YidC/SpoIIIJ protein YidD
MRPLFLICIFLLSKTADSASLIDAQFKLRRLTPNKLQFSSANQVGDLYKNFLAKSMYSKCRWFPSDSEYMKITSRQCGQMKGTLLAFSRFMGEHDAYRISKQIVNDHEHIRFLNFGRDCDLF